MYIYICRYDNGITNTTTPTREKNVVWYLRHKKLRQSLYLQLFCINESIVEKKEQRERERERNIRTSPPPPHFLLHNKLLHFILDHCQSKKVNYLHSNIAN